MASQEMFSAGLKQTRTRIDLPFVLLQNLDSFSNYQELHFIHNALPSWKSARQHCPSNNPIQQIKIDIALEATANYELLRQSFLESYSKDPYFQMTVQGLGTAVWRLNGRAKMGGSPQICSTTCQRILMKCHGRLGLPPASNQEFGKYLEKELQVTPDAAPFS